MNRALRGTHGVAGLPPLGVTQHEVMATKLSKKARLPSAVTCAVYWHFWLSLALVLGLVFSQYVYWCGMRPDRPPLFERRAGARSRAAVVLV